MADLPSNLRSVLAEWDALKYANEVMRTDGVGFDVILARRALVMERIIEAARAACTAGETTTEHEWLPNAAGSFTCDCCGAVSTLDPSAPCVGRDAVKTGTAHSDGEPV